MSSTKRENRKFHDVLVQLLQRNVQKSVMHVQSCCFANVNLLAWKRVKKKMRKIGERIKDSSLFSISRFFPFLLPFCVCRVAHHPLRAEPPSVFFTTSFLGSSLSPRGRVGKDPGNEVVFVSDEEKRGLCLNRIKT